ncbi:hypothetical protein [Polaribacter sp. IC073]|uniref:hypothetical protein n=1 Tax=Polaribacter sp. IC073 TaxID=2508540 RepID=UPI0011BD6854|nr:hypothetical protein [Polaribacter sp. IC073]TXD47340.1 hypothetical protein ES045_12140 [Polaribacter sp. IC073]
MKSAIKVNFSVEDLLKGKVDSLVGKMIQSFLYVGDKCVSEGRNNGSYIDRTGNLRASIGYVVLYNGKVQGKSKIAPKSQKLLEELTPKYNKGVVLVVVAGMNYAASVEAKNYNVLTSAELLAERLVPRMLKKVGFTE